MIQLSTVARAALVVALLQVVFVLAYVAPGHNAKPHSLPVGVVGSSAATAQFIQRLEQKGRFNVVKLQADGQALQAIHSRNVYGAFLLDQPQSRVLIASAASIAAEQAITAVATQAHVPARAIRDVVPLTANDPRGVAFNLLALPLLVTSILGALLVQAVMGRALPLAKRLLSVSVIAAITGLCTTVIIDPLFGIVPGSFLAEAGLLTLAFGGILVITDGLIRLVGAAGSALSFFLFLIIGNPASGVTTASEFIPAPWRQIGEIIPPGSIVAALRNTAYFDGAALLKPILALAGLALFGVGLQFAAEIRQTGRSRKSASSTAYVPSPATAASIGA